MNCLSSKDALCGVLKLHELHGTHPGVAILKAMARSYVWWPKIDSVIEETVRSCPQCSNNRTAPPAASLHPWTWLSIPWQRLHVNFATYEGNHYLIVVDAHSKWPEVLGPMRTTNAEATINALRTLFARYGTLSETEWHTASVGVTISSIFKWTD